MTIEYKMLINIFPIKHFLLAIFITQSFPAIAQSAIAQPSIPPSMLQDIEVSKAAIDVCTIDPDSRQCELMQFLMVKNSPVASEGNFLEIDANAHPRMLEYLLLSSKEKQSLINSMELNRKLQASRMYRALNVAKDKICAIKQESLPCMEILISFYHQADVETGDKLNAPANIPVEIKQSIRKSIAKEHPNLTPSSRLLLEATILSKMQEGNEAVLPSTPAPASKEKERKGRGICADKYSPSYDPQKCR